MVAAITIIPILITIIRQLIITIISSHHNLISYRLIIQAITTRHPRLIVHRPLPHRRQDPLRHPQQTNPKLIAQSVMELSALFGQ